MKIGPFNIGRREIKMAAPLAANSSVGPISGGASEAGLRSSTEQTSTLFGTLFGEMNAVQPSFMIEYLKLLEYLAMYNDDVSYAVDNIVQLGNTGWTISFDDGVSDEQGKVMIAEIMAENKNWYKGGLNALINDLLVQLAIYGAISAENVPNNSLNDLLKVVLVSPYYIRFMYDKASDCYKPFQKVAGAFTDYLGMNGSIPLNELTYKYYPMRKFGSNPYAVPPMLAALEGVEMDKDMVRNVKNIAKHLGTLGFLKIMLTPPTKKQGEDDQQYWDRLVNYQQMVTKEADKGFEKGLLIGFKGTHEMETQATTTNATGAQGLMEHVLNKKFAGLKQDALMLGRNFNVAETMANVILAKITSQSKNYQKSVSEFVQDTIALKLLLRGYKVEQVYLKFDESMVIDQVVKHNARQLQLANLGTLFNQGIISQQDYAVEAGYDKPDQEEPRPVMAPTIPDANIPNPALPGQPAPKKPATKQKQFKVPLTKAYVAELVNEPDAGMGLHIADLYLTDGRQLLGVAIDNCSVVNSDVDFDARDVTAMRVHTIDMFEDGLGKMVPEFNYEVCGHDFGKGVDSFISPDPNDRYSQYIKRYYDATKHVYDKATQKVAGEIVAALEQSGNGSTLQQITDKVFYTLYKNWHVTFSEAETAVIDKWVTAAYKAFKSDSSIFGNKAAEAPKPSFGLRDTRTINYFKKSDNLYLGKFITDEDTKKKVTQFIKDEFENNGIPVGDNQAVVGRFKQSFEDLLDGESWKITRVLNTTVNKLRNFAAVDYMQQAGVDVFEIRGVNDRLQCPYCADMQGRQFSVATALTKADSVTTSQPDTVGDDAPFITAVFKGKEGLSRLAGLSDAEVQGAGIDTPPFHSGCRDRVVAVFES